MPSYGHTWCAELEEYVVHQLTSWIGAGVGGAMALLLIIPLVLLFSYKKQHENKKIDTLIPIAGIGLIVLVYVEGIFQVIVNNVPQIIAKMKEFLDGFSGGGQIE